MQLNSYEETMSDIGIYDFDDIDDSTDIEDFDSIEEFEESSDVETRWL